MLQNGAIQGKRVALTVIALFNLIPPIKYTFQICLHSRVLDLHFFADPHPGKNLPDPDPGDIRGVKGKNEKNDFFHVSRK